MNRTHTKRRTGGFAALAVSLLALAACGSDKKAVTTAVPATTTAGGASATTGTGAAATTAAGSTVTTTAGTGDTGAKPKITVGSANFPENQLLMEIYGQQLERAGYTVDRKPAIGAREVYYKALTATPPEINLVPEYTNSLLSYVEGLKTAGATPKAKNVAEQVTELGTVLPANLVVGTPSTAEDKDVLVCTADAATKNSLKTLSDLAKAAPELTLGAAPEFETRAPFGIPGLKSTYGISFKKFVPLAIADVPSALTAKQIDCGNLFSTDSSITTNKFVTLEDDKTIVPNEAVLPVMTKDIATPGVLAVVDGVSSKLDTATLTKLVAEVQVDKKGADVVAKEFVATLPAP